MRRNAFACLLVFFAAAGAICSAQEQRNLRTERADASLDEAIAEAEEDYVRVRAEALAKWLKIYEKAASDARTAGDLATAARLEDAIARSKRAERAILPPPAKGVIQFGENRYAFLPEQVTWESARRRCEAMGGHLVTIETAEEGNFVVRKFGVSSFHAGATDREVEGKWMWLSGHPFEAFDQKATLDDNKGRQHALCWLHEPQRWDDGDEGYPMAFVCEWER